MRGGWGGEIKTSQKILLAILTERDRLETSETSNTFVLILATGQDEVHAEAPGGSAGPTIPTVHDRRWWNNVWMMIGRDKSQVLPVKPIPIPLSSTDLTVKTQGFNPVVGVKKLMTQSLNNGRTVRRIPVTKHNANKNALWIRLALQLWGEVLPQNSNETGCGGVHTGWPIYWLTKLLPGYEGLCLTGSVSQSVCL